MKSHFQIILIIIYSLCTRVFPSVQKGLYYYNDLDFQINNIGVASTGILFFQFPLLKSGNMLTDDSKIWSGCVTQISPTDILFGPYIRIKPLAFFDLKCFGGYYGIFNNIGRVTGFKGLGYIPLCSIGSPYDPDTINKIPSANRSGLWIRIKPVLQAKYLKIVFKTQFDIDYFKIITKDHYFLNQQLSCRYNNNSICYSNTTFFLLEIFPEKYIGIHNYYLSNRAAAVKRHRFGVTGIFNRTNKNHNEFYLASVVGAVISDNYYENKPYIAFSSGITLKIRNY